MDCSPPGSSVRFLGKNTGVGCHSLLQGIFLTQGLNPGLLHCRWSLYWLSHQINPRQARFLTFILFSQLSRLRKEENNSNSWDLTRKTNKQTNKQNTKKPRNYFEYLKYGVLVQGAVAWVMKWRAKPSHIAIMHESMQSEGNGNPLQYCLGNPMDRAACWATAHGAAKSQTWLSDWALAIASLSVEGSSI